MNFTDREHKLYSILHDINNQISVGYLALQKFLKDNPQASSDHAISRSENAFARASELGRDSARIMRQSSKIDPMEGLIPFNQASSTFEDRYKEICRRVDITHTLKIDSFSQNQCILFDEGKTFRADENMITNAKAANATHVDLKFSNHGDYLHYSLKDNGDGMDSQTLNRVLLGSHSNKKNGGYGLRGTKEIIEKMGGYFSIDSVEGEWTEISILIPIVQNNK